MSVGVELVTVGIALIVLGIVFLTISWRKGGCLRWKCIIATLGGMLFAGGLTSIHAGLGASREMSLQASMGRLASVSAALNGYWQESGAFPQHLGELVDGGWISPADLQSVFRADGCHADCDCVYVQGLQRDDPGSWPIVFDIPGFQKDGTRSVILLSGDVRIYGREDFKELVARFQSEFEHKRGRNPVFIRTLDN